jgi:hypothetical protein
VDHTCKTICYTSTVMSLDSFVVRTYDRKPHQVKPTKQKASRQSSLFECKKVVVLESVMHLNTELVALADDILGGSGKPDHEADTSPATETTDTSRSVSRTRAILDELTVAFIALETLEQTKIGKVVNRFVKDQGHPYVELREKATALIEKWKTTVKEGKLRRKRHEHVRKPVVSHTTTEKACKPSQRAIHHRHGASYCRPPNPSLNFIGMKRERSVEVTCGNSSTKRYLSAQQVERIRLNKEEALARLNKKYATVLGHENRGSA